MAGIITCLCDALAKLDLREIKDKLRKVEGNTWASLLYGFVRAGFMIWQA
jgi:muramidase (phage lysozyme)